MPKTVLNYSKNQKVHKNKIYNERHRCMFFC